LRKPLSSGFLLDHYPALLTARYGFATKGIDAFAVIEAIARKRGCIPKGRGGKPDIGKAASILLIDYRNGALGRISLETPELRTVRELTQPGAVDGEKDWKTKVSAVVELSLNAATERKASILGCIMSLESANLGRSPILQNGHLKGCLILKPAE